MNRNDNIEIMEEEQVDLLLRRLLHLKRYETPSLERITKNKHNIMRRVRDASHKPRWTLADLLELNIPWFFAEPRYGIAALFIVFAGLQFLGINSHKTEQNKADLYVSSRNLAAIESPVTFSTNHISYPKLPDNIQLFPYQQGNDQVKFVERVEEKK